MGRDLHLKWQGIPWLKIALSHLMLVQQNLLLSYKGLTMFGHFLNQMLFLWKKANKSYRE